jgi:hypothetical protein
MLSRRDRKVETSPTSRGAIKVQPAVVRRAVVTHRLRGSMLQSACAARLGSKRLLSALQQTPEKARRLRRLGHGDGLQCGLCFGLPLALFAGEPFFEAHTGFRSAPGFVCFLALGEWLGRRHVCSPRVCPRLFAGRGPGIKGFGSPPRTPSKKRPGMRAGGATAPFPSTEQ